MGDTPNEPPDLLNHSELMGRAFAGAIGLGLLGTGMGALLGAAVAVVLRVLQEKSDIGENAFFIGEIITAVLGTVAALFSAKAYDTWPPSLLLAGVGLVSWAVVRLLGSYVWNWPIEDEVYFRCALAGAMTLTAGCTHRLIIECGLFEMKVGPREGAWHEALKGIGLALDEFLGIFISGPARAFFLGAFAGACGGLLAGFLFGLVSGEIGRKTIGGEPGAAIGAAVLTSLGAAFGCLAMFREAYHRLRGDLKM